MDVQFESISRESRNPGTLNESNETVPRTGEDREASGAGEI